MKKLMVMLLAAGAFAIGSLTPAIAQYENPKPGEAAKAEPLHRAGSASTREAPTRQRPQPRRQRLPPHPPMHRSHPTSTRATLHSCTRRR